ncbi:VWA domain-containing protein [Steroidobacter sp. S1-65]|uniref:VWA domain-containing protein n=1 Tax=Steroidobacter gossypii TaxID=2805490 RepID=A0ABS1WST2_9GAMM|nr:VWA domain-containing protein [Steroidobacter gossypii]MBM0104029.1 VWA domain-containing protein [Steroidobacter gossypii]
MRSGGRFAYYWPVFERLFTHPIWAYRTGTFAFASAWPIGLLITSILVGAALVAWTLWRRRALGWSLLVPVGVLQTALIALILCLLWRPVLNVERVRDRENELAIAVDASASMAYGAAGQSRLQEVAAALQNDTLPRLEKTFAVRLFGFAQSTTPLDSLDSMPAPGRQTRIGDALTQVLQSAGSAPLAGVILFSDGAENGNTLSEERLAEIASYGVPVHTVGIGPEQMTDDLELERVEVASTAPAGSTIDAQIGIRHNGAAQARLRVYDRDNLVAARDVKLRPDAPTTQLSLDLPAGQAGTHELRFVLDPLEGERNVINNTRTRVVNVPATRRNILYVEGEPRWEYKFLRRAVDRDRALRVASIVRTTPNKHYRQGVNSPDELVDGFPSDAAELFGYDAVIIGSYEAAALRTEQHRLLKEFVDKRGGSVLMLAGRYGLSAGGWQNAALAQTLPVQLTGRQPAQFVQRQGQAQLTIYGAESTIPRLDGDPKRNLDRWKNLPPLADYQSLGRLKPGAIVLLEANGQQGRSPLLVWQHYGRGATYILATASTMRWQMRMPSEDQSHEMFWRQLMHAIASTAPSRVTVNSERTVYEDERMVRLEAEVRDERFEPISDATVELHVAPERDTAFSQIMQPSGQGDGRYTATLDAASAGLYRIEMSARVADKEVGTAITHVLRNDGVAEHFATYQHRDLLERIANATGGRYWPLSDLDGLAGAIPYSKAGIVERQTLDLWNLPIVFLTLLALKLAEWLLRLRWGRL